MKKLFLSAVAVLFGFGAFAQELGYGFKAGVNLPNYNFSNSDFETKSTTNFHVTGYLDAPINQMFSIQPGVSLQGKGAKLENDLGSWKQNTMWIEIPVNAVAKFPTMGGGNFFLGAGPYAAFGISGENKIESGDVEISDEFEFGKDGTQKGTDFGVNFLGGYRLGNGLTLGAGYGLGLADIMPDNSSDVKQNNRVLSFSIGYEL
ncbi:porin family protein [Albibacterium indicum]|uniref:porin family protein n=1 Tax=Albibacterium indicum TaxID=2292082 RepID=UPI000E5291D0|nr:porin family protein [Pedobacter indicus]